MFQKFTDYLSNLGSAKNTSKEKPKFEYTLNRDEKELLKHSEEKPKIIILYDREGGTIYCDLLIDYLKGKGFDVIPVTPQEGLSHPAFNGRVDGIYLPGGPNVPVQDDSDPRKKFEGELTKLAESRDIPLLGICRGQQTVGHYHGYKVTDIPEDAEQHELHYEHFDAVYKETQDATFNNKVVVVEGSQLYNALHSKLKHKDKSNIEYNVTCLHHQHVEENQDNNSLRVTGRGKFDRLVESFEKRTGKYYTIGFQHHPEAVISICGEVRKIKLDQIDRDSLEALADVDPVSDPDELYRVRYQCEKKESEVLEETWNEKAAKAEIGFFSKQVKQHYLDKAPKKEETQDTNDYYYPPCI
ncbi:gamma-glutamyl-gamma-aminobutyrate hydrolase family protein [Fluoribacter gormanii]|uniref:Anthranilate synthase component II n=1 Tax=Fluoribacter gormanii TaxID=464 RepID=A0A377GHQ3_9GAMM|nr:gamma-glutamyl-gamma-aminobutyrate hydrolase family protein [Fluoribacter gormanii]KTD01293.1 anthranilate synthase component II [Fluoribacter gormanii]SIR81135.1 Gamma-glutamyl-gamma-aminobutyrate hydrolase PuuD (putrescine degradation), contains GATase1-like domain [Fluoribacter gormanii]STO24316.1 anthranilate synthase component II [Fluoribacter gormanii]